MKTLFDAARRELRLRQQAQEIRQLRAEKQALEQRLETLRASMRHCISCDYRLQVLAERQHSRLDQIRRPGDPCDDD